MLILFMQENAGKFMMMTKLKNFVLTTNRLILMPLTCNELLLYSKPDDRLELELGLSVSSTKRRFPEEYLLTIERSIIPFVCENPNQFLFGTLWLMIHQQNNIIIGDIGFKGVPTENGLLEVGYITYPEFMGNGYMTEALKALTYWGFSQPGVKIILAETNKSNIASQRVLNKSDFMQFAETDEMFWWRLDKEDAGQMSQK